PAQPARPPRPGRARAPRDRGRARLPDGPRRRGDLRDRRPYPHGDPLGRAEDRALLPRPRGDLLESNAMASINAHYLKLRSSYLCSEIARRVREFQDAQPDAKLIRLGIGDVTRPLAPAVITAMHAAVDEMARAETFKGYGPETGYEFLLELIARHDYGERGVKVMPDEIFVGDGGKSDSANIQEIFAADCVVAVIDPIYPVYLDSNVMAGRAGAPRDDGLHRDALRFHRRSQGPHGPGRRWHAGESQLALVPAPVDEVQRRALRHPAGGRGRLHRRGPTRGSLGDRLLHGERPDHPAGT